MGTDLEEEGADEAVISELAGELEIILEGTSLLQRHSSSNAEVEECALDLNQKKDENYCDQEGFSSFLYFSNKQ